MKNANNLTVISENLVFNFQKNSINRKTGDMLQVFILPLNWVKSGIMDDDREICFDCIFSQSKTKKCYVRKGFSNLGLITKVKCLHKAYLNNEIPLLDAETEKQIIKFCKNKFIRFGAYGEPILLGESLTNKISKVSLGWTGYTHQYKNPLYNWAKEYFMASVESEFESEYAKKIGFRTFFVVDNVKLVEKNKYVNCPASKEQNYKTTCEDCLLCQGTKSKSKKSIIINKH